MPVAPHLPCDQYRSVYNEIALTVMVSVLFELGHIRWLALTKYMSVNGNRDVVTVIYTPRLGDIAH